MRRSRWLIQSLTRALTLLLTTLVLLAHAASSHAQPASDAEATAAASEAEARARFESGRLAFEDGRFDDALRDFEQSFQLSQRPQLLYNIGQVHDRLRHPAEAVEYFERYLEELPEAENRRAVEARIHLLQAEGDSAERPLAAAPEASRGRLRFTWVAAGVTVAATVTGIAMAVKTRHTYDALAAGCGARGGCTAREIDDSGGPRQQRTARALLGLAGGALTVGVVLFVVERARPGEGATRVSMGPRGVLVEGTF